MRDERLEVDATLLDKSDCKSIVARTVAKRALHAQAPVRLVDRSTTKVSYGTHLVKRAVIGISTLGGPMPT